MRHHPRLAALVAVLVLPALAWGQPPPGPPAPSPPQAPTIKLPATVQVEPGGLQQIAIETAGAAGMHYILFGDGIASFREYDPDPSTIKLQVLAKRAGTGYLAVFAWNAAGAAKASCKVIIVDANPAPAPTPAPPAPPADPFVGQLQAAYAADSAAVAAKTKTRDALVRTYAALQTYLAGGQGMSLADARAELKSQTAAQGVGPELQAVRQIVADQVAQAMGPTPDAKLEPPLRAKLAAVFGRAAAALGQVK